MVRSVRTVSVAMLACSLLLTAPLTGPVRAAVSPGLLSVLPLTDMNNVELDALNARLLISSSQGLLVTDAAGQPQATLLAGSALNDVKVSPDGSTAWVADRTGGSLDQIDLTDLRVLRRFPLPAGDVPAAVTPVSSKWIVFTHAGVGDPAPDPAFGGIGILNTSTGSVWQQPAFTGHPVSPTLTLIPGTRRVLALDSGPQAAVYDFATGRPVLSQPTGSLAGACTVVDVTISPDGQSFVPGCDNLTSVTEYRMSDFTVRSRYTLSYADPQYAPYVTSVAFSADASMLAVGQFGLFNNSLSVLRRSGNGWQGYYAKGFVNVQVTFPRGVAFSPDSTSIYTLGQYLPVRGPTPVTVDISPGTASSVPEPTSSMSLTSPSTVFVGDNAPVTGSLGFSNTMDADAGADRPITITRVLNGVGITVQEMTDAAGHFTFANTPTTAGLASYAVSYAGDELHQPTQAGITTRVVKHPTTLTMATTGNGDFEAYQVTASIHLGPTYTNRVVTVTLNGDVIASGSVDALGNLVVSTPPENCDLYEGFCPIALKAIFAGDARYLAAESDHVEP